jgi:beta-ribofuranosylaminobenzene 5'-phosphate synthase
MMRIQTGRRLHFGLFTPIPVPELNLVFGGIGAMVREPGVIVSGELSEGWNLAGCEIQRASEILLRLQSQAPELNPVAGDVEYVAPAHQGWGTGTQLALAIVDLCYRVNGITVNQQHSAQLTGRGLRSGIGVTGYQQTGFFLDHGKRLDDDSALSRVEQIPIPEAWRFVLVEPAEGEGLHAAAERRAFGKITSVAIDKVLQLEKLALEMVELLQINPDFLQFAAHLTHYNALAGELFQEVQGGCYSTPTNAERIRIMQANGATSVGQSSWGPGLFAFFANEEDAERFVKDCCLDGCRMMITQA